MTAFQGEGRKQFPLIIYPAGDTDPWTNSLCLISSINKINMFRSFFWEEGIGETGISRSAQWLCCSDCLHVYNCSALSLPASSSSTTTILWKLSKKTTALLKSFLQLKESQAECPDCHSLLSSLSQSLKNTCTMFYVSRRTQFLERDPGETWF